jgi:DNA helicase-2/ATP-dependent DNA helicase PcrA
VRRVGHAIDEARGRVAGAGYASAPVDLGSGTFGLSRSPSAADAPVAPAWQAGDRVRHRRYGIGLVVESSVAKGDEEVTVDFEEHGRRYLIAAYAGLERVG